MMGIDAYKLMSDLYKAKPDEANVIYRQFIQTLQERAAGGDNAATRLLETISKDTSLTRLDGKKLKDFSELFLGRNGAPFSLEEYKGQLFHLLTDNLEAWAVKNFKVKPAHWSLRTAELIKRAQGKVLLGLNPTFLLNNAINNLVTLGWDGLLEFCPARTRLRFLKELGFTPARFRAGATAAEVGDDLLSGMGEQIRKASRGGDLIQSMDDFVRSADKFPDFATLSQSFERYSSELAQIVAMRRYMDQVWMEGRAITRMDPELEAALDAVDPGLSKRVKKAIERGKSKAQIEKVVFRDLGRPSIKDVLTPQQKDLLAHFPGLVDDLDDALGRANTDEDIRAAFADARAKAQQGVQDAVARNMQRMTVEATEKVRIEGGQGLLDLFDNQMGQRAEFWLYHLDEMDSLAEEAGAHSGQARRAIWQTGLDRADRNWNTMTNIEGSKWLGAVEALSGDKASPEYVSVLNNLSDQHASWSNFYQVRRQLMDDFFAGAEELDDAGRSQLWHETNVKLNQEYVNSLLIEDELQGALDQTFVALYMRQFPDDPEAAPRALAWRGSIQRVRQRMAATMVLMRTGGQVPPELEGWLRMVDPAIQDRVMNLTKGIPPYAMSKRVRQEVMQEFMHGIYAPYIREMLDASNGTNPMRPVNPPATPPQEAIPAPIAETGEAGRQTPPEEAAPAVEPVRNPSEIRQEPVRNPSEIRQEPVRNPSEEDVVASEVARQATEDARADSQGVYAIAAMSGIGSDTAGGRVHILNVLKNYFRVDDISQVSPDMALEAFSKRELWKGAVDLEAQHLLDRRIMEWRADQIRRNQQRLELAAPQSFTRDALYRVAVEQVGEEKAGAYMQWHDQLATYWANLEPGRTADQWYESQAWTRGGFEAGGGLWQADKNLWRVPEQEISSAKTSINSGKLPASINQIPWKAGTINADIGGGRYDNVTSHLSTLGVDNAIYDPFNRSPEFNQRSVAKIANGKADTATVNNVLNVIQEERNRRHVIDLAANAVKRDGVAYFLVYEGDKSGVGRITSAGWQENRLASTYEAEISRSFRKVERHGNLIVASEPIKEKVLGGEGLAQLSPEEGIRYRVDRSVRALEDAMRAAGKTDDEITATIRDYGETKSRMQYADRSLPYWGELYEYQSAMRAENYIGLTGHPYDYQYRNELSSLQGRGLFQTATRTAGTEIARAQAIFPETGTILDRAWVLPDGKILDVHDLEHNAQGMVSIERMKEQGAIRVRYTKGDQYVDKTLMLEFQFAPSRSQLRTLEPYMSGDVIIDYGRGRNYLQPLHGYEETVGELARISGLFQGQKGVTRFIETGEAMVHAFEAADVYTFFHETAHVWLPMMPQSDVDIVAAAYKADTGIELPPGWQNGHESFVPAKEWWARSVERYNAEGRAPIPALRRMFEQFKKWAIEIYGKITGSQIDVKLSPEVTELIDRWMGKRPEIAPAVTPEAPIAPFRVFVNTIGRDGNVVGRMGAATPEAPLPPIEPFDWKTAKVGDILPGGQALAGRGFTRKMDAEKLAGELNGVVMLDGPNKWAVMHTPGQELPTISAAGPTIERNAEHAGIQIKFPAKPDPEVIERIKGLGYRWSSRQKVWYKKEKVGDWERLTWLRGSHELAPAAAPETPILATPAPDPGHVHWPTWEEWFSAQHYRQASKEHEVEARANYNDLIKVAVRNSQIGHEEAVRLIGKKMADRAMFDRISTQAINLTQQQFIDAVSPYTDLDFTKPNIINIFHRMPIKQALDRGVDIPDDILKDYPDLYVSKETPEPPPANVWDGTEQLFNAPKGQGSLFGEETAGFGLEAQKAPYETFNPPTSKQPGLFGLGEFTEAPKKPTVPEKAGAGPLFEQPTEAPTPQAKDLFSIGDIVRWRGKEYEINYMTGGQLRLNDLETHQRIDARPSPSEVELVRKAGEAKPEPVQDFRAAVRQMLIDYLADNPNQERGLLPRIFDVREIPGYGSMNMHDAIRRIGNVDDMKTLFDEVWDLTHKPQRPVDIPITIQPTGIESFIRDMASHFHGNEFTGGVTGYNPAQFFQTPREFEEWAQRVMGLDMNDELNLNLAYDSLEGAFNLLAREVRTDLDARNAPLADRLRSLSALENKLLRARRTAAKTKLQQFSTPLTISEAAGWAADIRPGDVLTEPTAGTANLVDKFSGRMDITIRVNEIDAGRRQVLTALGYEPTDINVQSAAWVIGPDGRLLPPMASTAVINPPWGAYTTGKYGTPIDVPVKLNDWSQRFTYLIMQRMSENSRLSGVMPTNWVYTMDRATRQITPHRSEFLRWLDQTYWVRAVIESPPDAYKQRGTDIGSLLVVVDKTKKPEGALPAIEAWGENAPKTWDEYAALVERLGKGGTHERTNVEQSQLAVRALADAERNARRPASGPDATGLTDPNARAGNPASAPDRIGHPATARPAAGLVTEGTGPSGQAGVPTPGGEPGIGQRPGRPDVAATPVIGERAPGTGVVEGQPAGVPEPVQPEPGAGAPAGRPGVTQSELQPQVTERLSPSGEPTGRYVESTEDVERRRTATATVEQAGGFTLYVARSPLGANEPRISHPSTVVETKALSGVKGPDLEEQYRPSKMVMDAYARGDISLEGQLDPIWAAVQQNDKYNMGMMIADDVGMGKSRTGAGFALDRIEKGRKRILVVTKDSRNVTNLMNNEFPQVAGGKFPAEMILLSGETMPTVKNGPDPIPTFNDRPVVYFTNIYQLPDFSKKIEALQPDAVIIDEVHNFKNIDDSKVRAETWNRLHKDWNRRNVSMLYLSATPGSDIADLQYLYGLKIWPMDGFSDWVGVITGRISPDQAKKVATAKNLFEDWGRKVQEAVNRLNVAETSIEIRGRTEIGIDLGNGIFAIDTMHDNDWNLVIVRETRWGMTQDFILHGVQKNQAILTGSILSEQHPGINFAKEEPVSLNEWQNAATREYEKRFPVPQVDRDTIGKLGMSDASDALDVDSIGKKKGWGAGRTAFESTIPPEHTEQIMRELKVGGSYMSRDISRIGVEFEVKKVDVTPERIEKHDKRIDLYRRIIEAFYKYGKYNEGPKAHAAMFGVVGDIQADAKRDLFDMRLVPAMDDIDAALARGEQVVLSVVSVGDSDIEKGGNLASALEKINTVKVKKQGKGDNATYSDPEDIPEAMITVATIKDELRELGPLRSPVEILKERFGHRVAFITGNENDKLRLAAMKDFQNNRLDIVVISKAGKEGINLHDITGRKKVHLIVADYEWSATNFKQELGRVDRTGQKSNPVITLLHTGNAGEVKFVSTIANRMKGLGATSKGGAESTGTGALNEEFELGSNVDKLALSATWIDLSRAEKSHFIDRYFNSQSAPTDKRRELPSTAEAIKKFTLALQSMKTSEANKILELWMNKRAEMMKATAGDIEAKKMMSRGEILRKTVLGDNLTLVEAKDQTGHRFGVLSGVLTPHMNRLAGVIASDRISLDPSVSWREWINFKDAQSGEYASGLVVPVGKIERVAKDFGQQIGVHRTPETALMDLKAGDRIPIRGPDNLEWELYVGHGGYREGKIVVDGAKMAHKDAVMRNGAQYDSRGNYFFVPEEKLLDFLKRFQLRESGGLAQSMQPGETYAFGPSGERYQFRYRVVSLDDLIQSHLDTFDPNPRYPRELQPRARDRAAYREQVQQIAQGLDERILTETHQVDSGTPITGPDNVVENGNGRVMALRRARMDYPERWSQYQDMLRARLVDYGLQTADLSNIKDPVLVRERLSDVDRVKFAGEAQASQSMTLTVDELAGSDAKYVDDAALVNLTIGEEQTVEGALRGSANRDIVNAFLARLPAGEKSAFLAPDGSLSMDGLTRLRNAIFVHVYPGDSGRRLAEAFMVSQSEAVGNIRAAIFDTLGTMSQAEALIREGRRDADLSIVDDIARAVDQYVRLKQQTASISDYVNQPGLIEKQTDAFQDAILRYLDENARSRKRMRALLALYADNIVNTQQDPAQASLFGGARSTKGEILDAAAEQITGHAAGFEEAAPAAPVEPEISAGLATPIDADPTSPEPQVVPAVASPLGTAEQYHEPPVEEAAFEGWMKEIDPTLRQAEQAMLDPAYRRKGVMDLDRDLDPATKKELRKYLGRVGADLTDAKLATVRYGEMKRDAALLNYGARTGFDNVLGAVMPYEFWMTRSIYNWALRALGRPAILANYARLKNLQEKYMEGEDSIPTRLKSKVKIPAPFLPDWMGDSIYIDPLKQLFPFQQMIRPWEKLAEEKNLETKKAESALDQLVQDEQITETQAAQAKATRSGPIWQRALAQARQDMDSQLENPLDFAFMMSSPSLPLSIGYNMMTGHPEKISQLPVTRMIQANTAALGIGGARGFNIEGPLRKAVGLPEVDRFEDYRVDRMLANLAADGLVTPDDAHRAMMERTGPAFTLAQQRVSQMGIAQYWGAPLGVDMFPEGERELRELKTEYDAAREKWSKGDKNALTVFYDEHPEYETRAASFRDPTERLRRYLIAEVWDRYSAMPGIHKEQAREQLGTAFQDAFLDKETRSYDAINTTTLATWAQMLGANNPSNAPEVPQVNLELAPKETAAAVQAYYDEADKIFPKSGMVLQALYLLPEGQRAEFEKQYPQIQAYYRWKDKYLADHPDIIPWVTSESNELYGLPNDIQAYVYNYRARKEEMYPNIYAIQDGYYDQTSSKAKSAYLKAHPELTSYWSWRREVAAAYPQAAAYILSDATMQKAILGDEYTAQQPQLTTQDLAMLTPYTQQALLASVYSGEEIRAGAWEELEDVWVSMGRPYGTLENWVNKVVKPLLRDS
jgi:hypothetical protein